MYTERVLYVCGGNIARSQMAEGFHRHFYRSSPVKSAGMSRGAVDEYKNLPDIIIEIMSDVGVDISRQKPKVLTKEMFEKCDRCFFMRRREKIPDYMKGSEKVVFWEIEDPRGKKKEIKIEIRNQIREKVRAIDPTSS